MNYYKKYKIMNKTIPLFRRLALMVGLIVQCACLNASTLIDGLYYDLDTSSRTATVTYETMETYNYASLPASVKIPETVTYNGETFTVTKIADRAFAYCKYMEEISIPGTVTEVGTTSSSPYDLPFYDCTSLKKVRFEDGKQSISLGADFKWGSSSRGLFASCPLEEVYIGRNIIYKDYSSGDSFASRPECYGYSAFYNQPKLAKVTFSSTVTEIPAYLFYKNTAMTLTDLPKVKIIGESAFEGCSKLTTLNFGQDLETVGGRAFCNCTNVTKLTFPDAITTIGDKAFEGCSSVTEVTVGSKLQSIGASAFQKCGSFTAIILPDNFAYMGASVFEDCKKLTVAKLGNSLRAVPEKAFKNCIVLSEMTVPASSVSIGDQAFYNDSALAVITMNEGLKTIGNEVFWNNSGVRTFVIPGTVTSIGTNSFIICI